MARSFCQKRFSSKPPPKKLLVQPGNPRHRNQFQRHGATFSSFTIILM